MAATSRLTNKSPLVGIMTSIDNGSRPAGGTARTPGNKTPRKVQWAVDAESGSSTHALDEHGLDVSALLHCRSTTKVVDCFGS
jgi:hypothetical protein